MEFAPHAICGKYGATVQVVSAVANFLAVLSVWAHSLIPRESSVEVDRGSGEPFRILRQALRHREYMLYLAGFGPTVLSTAVTAFLPLYYAWSGVTGGIAPLVAGRWGFLAIDAYTSIFLVSAAFYLLSLALFSRAPADASRRIAR